MLSVAYLVLSIRDAVETVGGGFMFPFPSFGATGGASYLSSASRTIVCAGGYLAEYSARRAASASQIPFES